jgi:hypothetical protein
MAESTDIVEMDDGAVEAYKVARHQIGLILDGHCESTVDVNNVRARLEAAILACAEFGQADSALVEQAYGVGLKAFLSFKTNTSRPRRTRPS